MRRRRAACRIGLDEANSSTFNHVANRSRVGKDVEYEFRGLLLIHFFFPGEQGSRGW